MIKSIIILSVIFGSASCSLSRPKRHPYVFAECPFPNGTDKAMHIYNCDGNYNITCNQATVYKENTTQTLYPLDPKIPMTLSLTANNKGPQIKDNKNNVKLYEYQHDWITNKCQWNEIPTFGLLDNIDGCQYAHNCPLTQGALTLDLPLDLSPYQAIIQLLAADKPYQLHIQMHNYNSGSDDGVSGCFVAQVKFS